jgi:hypothetical protein
MHGRHDELFHVLALDAKGVARSRITGAHAATLLAEAVHNASEGVSDVALPKAKREKAGVQSTPIPH